MHITHVQYTVKPEYAATNRGNIERVMSDLRTMKPTGLRYATYLKPDGRTFIHFAVATDEGSTTLQNLPSFKTFQAELKASGPETNPEASKLSLVASMFDLESWVAGD